MKNTEISRIKEVLQSILETQKLIVELLSLNYNEESDDCKENDDIIIIPHKTKTPNELFQEQFGYNTIFNKN